jgi:hypothetical protein
MKGKPETPQQKIGVVLVEARHPRSISQIARSHPNIKEPRWFQMAERGEFSFEEDKQHLLDVIVCYGLDGKTQKLVDEHLRQIVWLKKPVQARPVIPASHRALPIGGRERRPAFPSTVS